MSYRVPKAEKKLIFGFVRSIAKIFLLLGMRYAAEEENASRGYARHLFASRWASGNPSVCFPSSLC